MKGSRNMRPHGPSHPVVVPFPRTDASAPDVAAILIAEFLADQVAREIVAQERAYRLPAAS